MKMFVFSAKPEENVSYYVNKGADQHVHPHSLSLISINVVPCLNRITSLVTWLKISLIKLVSVAK